MTLRLDLIVRTYPKPGLDIGGKGQDRWTWRLWSGSRIVSTSGPQLYSRRIDCARGAEVGAGVGRVVDAIQNGVPSAHRVDRYQMIHDVEVRVIDWRAKP